MKMEHRDTPRSAKFRVHIFTYVNEMLQKPTPWLVNPGELLMGGSNVKHFITYNNTYPIVYFINVNIKRWTTLRLSS